MKLFIKEATKMLQLSPTTDIRHEMRLEMYLLAKASIGSPIASITMINANTNEKAMEVEELPL